MATPAEKSADKSAEIDRMVESVDEKLVELLTAPAPSPSPTSTSAPATTRRNIGKEEVDSDDEAISEATRDTIRRQLLERDGLDDSLDHDYPRAYRSSGAFPPGMFDPYETRRPDQNDLDGNIEEIRDDLDQITGSVTAIADITTETTAQVTKLVDALKPLGDISRDLSTLIEKFDDLSGEVDELRRQVADLRVESTVRAATKSAADTRKFK